MRRKIKIRRVLASLLLALVLPAGNAAAEAVTEEAAEAVTEAIAPQEDRIERSDVVEDWMTPIYGDSLVDGTYEIEVDSSSAMFKIIACQLTVDQGEMTADITLNGDGYLKLYMGTVEEAAAAPEEDKITFVENEEGRQVYTVPVEALDMGIDCAAFSARKEQWYDRVLVFKSTSLPLTAYQEAPMKTAEDLGLEDGTYTAEAVLGGGSGRASIESPALITVEEGAMTLQVIMSSPNYDYMLVDGERFEPVNEEGNSTFLIPLPGFDYPRPVTADTVAMSTPHEIDYTIQVDSATVTVKED